MKIEFSMSERRVRTRDIHLGKVVLYQLSYSRMFKLHICYLSDKSVFEKIQKF